MEAPGNLQVAHVPGAGGW